MREGCLGLGTIPPCESQTCLDGEWPPDLLQLLRQNQHCGYWFTILHLTCQLDQVERYTLSFEHFPWARPCKLPGPVLLRALLTLPRCGTRLFALFFCRALWIESQTKQFLCFVRQRPHRPVPLIYLSLLLGTILGVVLLGADVSAISPSIRATLLLKHHTTPPAWLQWKSERGLWGGSATRSGRLKWVSTRPGSPETGEDLPKKRCHAMRTHSDESKVPPGVHAGQGKQTYPQLLYEWQDLLIFFQSIITTKSWNKDHKESKVNFTCKKILVWMNAIFYYV